MTVKVASHWHAGREAFEIPARRDFQPALPKPFPGSFFYAHDLGRCVAVMTSREGAQYLERQPWARSLGLTVHSGDGVGYGPGDRRRLTEKDFEENPGPC